VNNRNKEDTYTKNNSWGSGSSNNEEEEEIY
jgi:hypothetical protein